MTMSKDRIDFTPAIRGVGHNGEINIESLKDALGMPHNTARDVVTFSKRVRCRPSQFARFLLAREAHGIAVNSIKVMNPELIVVEDVESIYDASLNPNTMEAKVVSE